MGQKDIVDQKQKDIDFLFLELEIVKGVNEILPRLQKLGPLAIVGSEKAEELINAVVIDSVPKVERLRVKIEAKEADWADQQKSAILRTQKANLVVCVKSLISRPVKADAACKALDAVINAAPEKAKKAK